MNILIFRFADRQWNSSRRKSLSDIFSSRNRIKIQTHLSSQISGSFIFVLWSGLWDYYCRLKGVKKCLVPVKTLPIRRLRLEGVSYGLGIKGRIPPNVLLIKKEQRSTSTPGIKRHYVPKSVISLFLYWGKKKRSEKSIY